MSAQKPTPLGRCMGWLGALFGSIGLSCSLLCLLGVLTFLGTLAQVDAGLHAAQKQYFESFFLIHDFGPFWLPLPGANLALTLLFFNLAYGGIFKLARRPGKLGILITHTGMCLLLLAGFIKLYLSQEGHMTLFEGQRADYFQSYYAWEIAIAEDLGEGALGGLALKERVIGQEHFLGASAEAPVRVAESELPFELELTRYFENSAPLPKGPMFDVAAPVVDGVFLEERPAEAETERNAAGLYASVIESATGLRHDFILWGLERAPFVCEIAGRKFSFDLRHERYPLPFELQLEEFTKIDHPRMNMPREFSSAVTVLNGSTQRPVEISMNEPLRTSGLVLYQASWGPSNARPGEPLFSTLAVVRNPADQLPLVACVIIALGLLLHFSTRLMRWIRREHKTLVRAASSTAKAAGLLLSLSLCVSACPGSLSPGSPSPGSLSPGSTRSRSVQEDWPTTVVERMAALPVQDGGRVKPLSTYASYALLRISGKRTLKLPSGRPQSATEWLLDTLFRPELARTRTLFLVQDSAVIHAVGLQLPGKRKRDRYSFEELESGVDKLFQLAHEYSGIPKAARDSVQTGVVTLAHNVNEFLDLSQHANFARTKVTVPPGHGLETVFGARKRVSFAEFMTAMPQVASFFANAWETQRDGVLELFESTGALAQSSDSLALFPPAEISVRTPSDSDEDAAAKAWLTPADILRAAYEGHFASAEHVRALVAFQELARGADPEAASTELSAALIPLSQQRGEYDKVLLELRYYDLGLIGKSLVAFLAAFLVLAFGWLRPASRLGGWAYRISAGLTTFGTGLLIAAIVMRCLIRGRPPVSTLYETVLFVTATGCVCALALELLNRRRIALAATAFLGSIGLFIANGYETLDKQDTMPSLVAVLDTNFWLATHVTTITIGYAAGMLAACLASAYILAKAAFALRPNEDRRLQRKSLTRELGRMVYGVLCFGLIFSVVGTILGGIWANDSWGRFWGWDPKENGALLICLSQIAILHARMGGYLKEHGVCVAVAFGGIIVAFSWWGVNLLGVGLHSYGFTSGIQRALVSYYGLQGAVVAIGLALAVASKWQRRGSASKPAR